MIRALTADISDPDVARLPAGVGSIEQWATSAEILARPHRRPAVAAAYRAWMNGDPRAGRR
jgi:hypothetical protein